MNKKEIKFSHCILGNGYTSLIASQILHSNNVNSIIIGLRNHFVPRILELSNRSISPIQIFPVKDSSLYRILKMDNLNPRKTVKVSYHGVNTFDLSSYKIYPNSLADFLINNASTRNAFTLSLKQWGTSMLSQPFSEVQNKIQRHYISTSNNSRLGFINGFTPYYYSIKNINANNINCYTITEIDYKNKVIITDQHHIYFQKLISTIPLNKLLSLCSIQEGYQLKYEGSYFLYFRHESSFEENQILYDCDLSSDILRIYSATNNIIIVQLPCYRRRYIKISDITNRLIKLIPNLKHIKYEKHLFLTMSYPIESIKDVKTEESIRILKENSVFPFGRLGNWEYKDLHELDWESII